MTRDLEDTAVHSELQDLVLDSAALEEFLDGLVSIAARSLTETTGYEIFAGITLLRPKRSATVASSSEEAQGMDEIQYGFDDGPCLRAAREHRIVVVEDFRNESRFGKYTDAVMGTGLRSALGVPILLEGEANSGLDLYCREPAVFDAPTITLAEAFAERASRSMQLAVRVSGLRETSEHLSAAMENRTTIDLAVGIIMAQNRCSQGEAVNILKAASSARNVKMHAVAAAVVQSVDDSAPQTHFDR